MAFDKIRSIIMEQLSVGESMVSLDAVEIIMAIEEEFDIEIPDEEAEKFQLVSDLVKYVEEHCEQE